MHRSLIFLWLLLFTVFVGNAQPDSLKKTPKKLLYYVDDPGASPAIPFIENYLKDFTYSDKEQQPVYGRVMSLNALDENKTVSGKIMDAFGYWDRGQTGVNDSKAREIHDAEIANYLLNYDKFLIIKSHPFNTVIEYQFTMYEVDKSAEPGIKDIPVLKNYRSTSAFISLPSATYKEELIFALKQVCIEINEPPKAEIKIEGKTSRWVTDTIFLPVQDTIRLEAIAIDPDSPKERFSYTWSVSNEKLYSQITYGKNEQSFMVDTPSTVKVGLAIGDGINLSARKDVVLSFIRRPELAVKEDGNVFFIGELGDISASYMVDIRDDIKSDEYYTSDYLYRKYLFGRRRLMWGEDSLVVFYTKGKLRVANATASDSVLSSTYTLRYVEKDSIDPSGGDQVRKGSYATFHLRPQRKLASASYLYTFYAEEKGVKSNNLRLRLNFVRVRQLSIMNEYVYSWMGAKKGGAGNILLGINWQPFSFMQFSVAGSFLYGPSKNLRNQADARIQTGVIRPRLVVELFKPNSTAVNRLAIYVQQFEIERQDKTKKSEYLYGFGLKEVFPFMGIGSRTDIFTCYNYFPNFEKKTYISGVGMFEISLGLNYHFLDKRRTPLAGD
jgi:hypothetical protein